MVKTLRKKKNGCRFATHRLRIDVRRLRLPSRVVQPGFPANDRAIGSDLAISGAWTHDRQIEILSRATPKRDYLLPVAPRRRLFGLVLASCARFYGRFSRADQALIARVLQNTAATASLPIGEGARRRLGVDLIPRLRTGRLCHDEPPPSPGRERDLIAVASSLPPARGDGCV